ncbi:TonB-linked outer membrane protein, SusC/RagA family [Dyadobacter soli]|uniref:TonB-linked outer membrane protein, SusC/RagA family n=1 Tax=Dyadobacter soli TaxID=659014 RepID=A0A1G7VH97_9BACT|nr:TonB-dependent receptor [Dyadobacter soli]SDG59195.1 TonB-linked outer membrane protein, SusC/RagA family [Dyadobacter soli]
MQVKLPEKAPGGRFPMKVFLMTWLAPALLGGGEVNATAPLHAKSGYGIEESIKVVRGKVTDAKGAGLPQVTVKVKGTNVGTLTDLDGNYVLNVEDDVKAIVFSFIGFVSQQIDIDNKAVIDVVLQEDATTLNDVVVVGYGTQKKGSLVGAISTVKVSDVKVAAPRSLANAMAGKVAGVISVQRSGEPGKDDAQFWIRGISTFGAGREPLVLVDGVERAMNNVEPEDIENFSVLKDASATAVYGIRGANGVILITTRRGKEAKPVLSMKFERGMLHATSKPKFVDAPTYLTLLNEANLATNPSYVTPYTPEVIEKYRSGEDPYLYPNVDWMKLMLKNFSSNQRATLNVTGGTEKAKYYISGSYYGESGIWGTDALKNYNSQSKLQRITFRSNTDLALRKDLELSLGLGGYLMLNNYPGDGNSGGIWYNMMLATPAKYAPTAPDPEDPSKVVYLNSGGSGNFNPYQYLVDRGFTNQWANTLQTDLTLNYDATAITKGLKASMKFSYDAYSFNNISRLRSGDAWTVIPPGRDPKTGNLVLQKTYTGSQALSYGKSAGGNRRIYFQANVNYDRQFGDHGIGAMLLYNQQDYQDGTAANSIDGLPFRFQGVVGRVTYNYLGRYYIEANAGYNGSENFEKGHRFGLFPSVGLGWVASDEPFFADHVNQNAVSYLKFRGSVGMKGNDKLGGRRFAYLTTVGSGYGQYTLGQDVNTGWGSVGEDQWGANLTWEKEREVNAGFEIRFLKDFYLQTDFFTRHRTGIFMQRNSIPQVSGLNNRPWGNIGEFKNHGMETTLEYNHRFGDVTVSLRGNYTFARNNLLDNDEPDYTYTYQNTRGKRLSQPFGLIADGLFRSEEEIASSPRQTFGTVRVGDIKYKDVNGDGQVDTYDEVAIGNPDVPEVVYGFGTSLAYKGFDASVFFQGAGNMDFMLGGDGFFPFTRGETQGNVTYYATDRWMPENPRQDALFPRLSSGSNPNNYRNSTWWQRKADYLRLKTAEIGYTVPKRIMQKVKVNGFRIYVSGLNLHTFSKFKFWDPELGNGNGAAYPLQRSFIVGANINF